MTCKDCYHFDACVDKLGTTKFYDNVIAADNVEKLCPTSKANSLVLELPCEIGKTVFIIGCKYRHGRMELWINTGKFKLSDIPKLGKTVFLTREAAEQALKEMCSDG